MILYNRNDRVNVANQVLQSFAPDTTIRLCPTGYVIVEWLRGNGEKIERRWMTRGQDWYPIWHHYWARGGTACVALSQLVRWIQDKPVMGISTWQHWAGEQCRLLRQQGDNGQQAISTLLYAGYPWSVPCVLCGEHGNIGDWWSLKKVSGPCCGMNRGCRQKGKA